VHGHGLAPGYRETTTAAETAMLTAAVNNWTKESNGRVEARTFAFHGDLPSDAIGDALATVGLRSAVGMKTGVGACSVMQVWQQLFTAGSGAG
jgi:hypothetical protein